eukprot:Clim_evm77s149 gene=Clim_evmTU77s149
MGEKLMVPSAANGSGAAMAVFAKGLPMELVRHIMGFVYDEATLAEISCTCKELRDMVYKMYDDTPTTRANFIRNYEGDGSKARDMIFPNLKGRRLKPTFACMVFQTDTTNTMYELQHNQEVSLLKEKVAELLPEHTPFFSCSGEVIDCSYPDLDYELPDPCVGAMMWANYSDLEVETFTITGSVSRESVVQKAVEPYEHWNPDAVFVLMAGMDVPHVLLHKLDDIFGATVPKIGGVLPDIKDRTFTNHKVVEGVRDVQVVLLRTTKERTRIHVCKSWEDDVDYTAGVIRATSKNVLGGFVFSCISRKDSVVDQQAWRMAVGEDKDKAPPLIGVYTFGEIGPLQDGEIGPVGQTEGTSMFGNQAMYCIFERV